MRELASESNALKSSYEENIRKLQDDAVEKSNQFADEKRELETKQSENEETSSGKLSDLKKKAEMKIRYTIRHNIPHESSQRSFLILIQCDIFLMGQGVGRFFWEKRKELD